MKYAVGDRLQKEADSSFPKLYHAKSAMLFGVTCVSEYHLVWSIKKIFFPSSQQFI